MGTSFWHVGLQSGAAGVKVVFSSAGRGLLVLLWDVSCGCSVVSILQERSAQCFSIAGTYAATDL